MKQKDTHYLAFDDDWFAKHQKTILVIFNLVYKFFPSLFFKSGERDDFKGNKIIEVGNNHATCDAGLQYFKKSNLIKTASENPANNHRDRRIYKTILRKMKQGKIKEELKLLPARKAVFFNDWNYSKMLYNAFKPMWWAMHWWDELVADRWVPQLSFGFSTLEVYPDASPETDTVDSKLYLTGLDVSWESLIATENCDEFYTSSANDYPIVIKSTTTTNQWGILGRAGFTFDTHILTSGITILSTVMSLYGTGKVDNLSATPDIDIYEFTPASDNALVVGDFSQIGSVSQTGNPITYSNWSVSGYNDFTFNATGIGNVSKTGISKFGTRNANYDVAGSPPTWASLTLSRLQCYFADNGSNKPKLVVTYTTVSLPTCTTQAFN